MIELKELKEKIKLQEKRKIANVSMVDFSLMYEIIDRAIAAENINKWQPIETAPKNKAILLDVGLPWPVYGIFNTMNDEFSYADIQAENFENATDIYFQTDYEKNPVAWMPLPDIAKKLQSNNNDCSFTTKGINDAQE